MQSLDHILYFADGDFSPTRALQRAVALAQKHQAQLTLMDITVESNLSADLIKRFGLADDVQQCEQRLAALTHLAETCVSGQQPMFRVSIGTPFIEVIRTVQHNGHDLLLKPVRNRPDAQSIFTSTDMHLLRKCPCPVWMEQEPTKGEAVAGATVEAQQMPVLGKRVLAAVDAALPGGESINRRILDAATAAATERGGALDIVHVWQTPFEPVLSGTAPQPAQDTNMTEALAAIEQHHASALETLGAEYSARANDVCTHLLRGEPAKKVLECARTLASDLLVLATLSRPREPGLFIGTTAEDLLYGAQTSVLALKPSGFVSPVQ